MNWQFVCRRRDSSMLDFATNQQNRTNHTIRHFGTDGVCSCGQPFCHEQLETIFIYNQLRKNGSEAVREISKKGVKRN